MAVCSAGLAEFSATLSYRGAEDLGPAPTLPDLPETVRLSVVETDDPGEGRREIRGEILALSEDDLALTLETLLRSLTITAAISEAVLESRVARLMPVRGTPAAPLQALALDLREAGFGVRFGPTWMPLAEGTIGLGTAGAEEELGEFLADHPAWRAV